MDIINTSKGMNLVLVLSLKKKLYSNKVPIELLIQSMFLSSVNMIPVIKESGFNAFNIILDIKNDTDAEATTNIMSQGINYDWLIFIRINRPIDYKNIANRVIDFIKTNKWDEWMSPRKNNLFITGDKIIIAYHNTFNPREFIERIKNVSK
jgi:hypothetical protein